MILKELKSDLITTKYTRVFEERDFDLAPSYFEVCKSENDEVLNAVKFQNGAIKESGVNGVMNEDLIAMVIRRLECFQQTQFKCCENAVAITKLEEALMWLRKRTNGRELKGIEGTHEVDFHSNFTKDSKVDNSVNYI